jgi:hypothetical protein
LDDGLHTFEQLQTVVEYFWKTKADSNCLRDNLAFLISHYGLLRGESVRRFELPDMFVITLSGEAPAGVECKAVIFRMCQGTPLINSHWQGKTNQENSKRVTGMIRHQNVLLCGQGALGLYFFERFHVSNHPFPDFSRSELWYDLKVRFLVLY